MSKRTLSKRLIVPAVVLLGITLIVAGCGSGDGDTTTTSLTKAQFIKKANAVCAKLNGTLKTAGEAYINSFEGQAPPSAAAATEVAAEAGETVLIPAMQLEVEELNSLPAPNGDEAQVTAIVDAFDEGVEEAEKQPDQAVNRGVEASDKAAKLASEYGLEGC